MEWGKIDPFLDEKKGPELLKNKTTLRKTAQVIGSLICGELVIIPITSAINDKTVRTAVVTALSAIIFAEVCVMQYKISSTVIKDTRLVHINNFKTSIEKKKEEIATKAGEDAKKAEDAKLKEDKRKQEEKFQFATEELPGLNKNITAKAFEVNTDESVILISKKKITKQSYFSMRPTGVVLEHSSKKEKPNITLNDKGLELQAGDAKIILNSEGITIAFGTGKNESMIFLNKDGICLSGPGVYIQAGASDVCIKGKKAVEIRGKAVKLTGDTTIDKSLTVSQNIDLKGVLKHQGQTKISGPMMIGN